MPAFFLPGCITHPKSLKSTFLTGGLMSGYVSCACRDCFEIAISGDDDEGPALCNECEDAGCDAEGDSACDSADAYGGMAESEDD